MLEILSMSTQELKTALHESIENIDDNDFLNAIMQIVNRKYTINQNPQLTEWQLNRIEESKNQIDNGDCFSNRAADILVEKWLQK